MSMKMTLSHPSCFFNSRDEMVVTAAELSETSPQELQGE